MDKIEKNLLEEIADIHEVPEGAYNIRANGKLESRNTTANIDIVTKKDKPGIDIIIKPGTVNESVHIPVILSESGLKDLVYNDFYIGEGADVTIVAGCGIHNCGDQASEHDGIHTFYIEKDAKVRYIEKHYGEGDGKGDRIFKSDHCCAYRGRRLYGDGDRADQGRKFHRAYDRGGSFRRSILSDP